MIMTIAVCLAFIIFAAMSAFYSQSPSDFVLDDDKELFLPPVIKAEGLYRSFVINVAFLGIATVIGGFQFGSSSHFDISGVSLMALAANLAWGGIAAVCLHADSSQEVRPKRRLWVISFVVIGLLLFVGAVASVYG